MSTSVANIIVEGPLAETFGYATDIHSMSQGQGTFAMELACYRKTPAQRAGKTLADMKKPLAGA